MSTSLLDSRSFPSKGKSLSVLVEDSMDLDETSTSTMIDSSTSHSSSLFDMLITSPGDHQTSAHSNMNSISSDDTVFISPGNNSDDTFDDASTRPRSMTRTKASKKVLDLLDEEENEEEEEKKKTIKEFLRDIRRSIIDVPRTPNSSLSSFSIFNRSSSMKESSNHHTVEQTPSILNDRQGSTSPHKLFSSISSSSLLNQIDTNTTTNTTTTTTTTTTTDITQNDPQQKSTNTIPTSSSKTKRSIFDYRLFTTKRRYEDPTAVIHPHLKKSNRMIRHNQYLFLATVLSFVGNVLIFIVTISTQAIFNIKSHHQFYVNIAQIIAAIVFVCCVAHRLLAYLGGFILRTVSRGSIFEDEEMFDIHFGWISFRGCIDRCELVIHNIIWYNPTAFDKTPFFLYIKEMSWTFDIRDFIRTKGFKNELIFDEVKVDTIELYIERNDSNSLNIWSAITDKEGSKEVNLKKFMDGGFREIIQKLKANLTKNKILSEKLPLSPGAVEEPSPTIIMQRLIFYNILIHPNDILSAHHVPPSDGTDFLVEHMYLTYKKHLSGADGEPLVLEDCASKVFDSFSKYLLKHNKNQVTKFLATSAATQTKNYFGKSAKQ